MKKTDQKTDEVNLEIISDEETEEPKPKTSFKKDHIFILVVSNNKHNYINLFKDTKVAGIPLRADQASWDEIHMSCYESTSNNPNGLVVELSAKIRDKPFKGTSQSKRRTCKPDIILIRNVCRSNDPHDYRNVLFGFMYSGVPVVNNAYSIYCHLERILVHAELKKIQKKLGKENFPLIDQYFHSGGMDINFVHEFPVVAKVGPVHAGFGKSLIKDSDRLRDLKSVVSLHRDYCTTERFIDSDYELRLQKIGGHYRAMKKQLLSYWKSNVLGTCAIEDIEVSKKHKLWLDECSKMFGGLDIFALDVLHSTDDKFHILELNGTSIGFGPDHVGPDLLCIKEVVVNKIKEKVLVLQAAEEEEKIKLEVSDHEVENANLKNVLLEKEKDILQLKKDKEILQKKIQEYQEKSKGKGKEKKFSIFNW